MVCVCFVLAFAAGVCVGLLAGRSASGSRLSRELDLTREQREQMRQIWSEVMRASEEQQWQRRCELQQERDEAIRALLTDEQKRQHEQLMGEYARKLDGLSQERGKRFDEAVEKTKLILTESQRKRYEQLLETGCEPRGRPGGGPPHRPGGGPGRGAFRENRDAAGAEVQDGPRGQEKSLEE